MAYLPRDDAPSPTRNEGRLGWRSRWICLIPSLPLACHGLIYLSSRFHSACRSVTDCASPKSWAFQSHSVLRLSVTWSEIRIWVGDICRRLIWKTLLVYWRLASYAVQYRHCSAQCCQTQAGPHQQSSALKTDLHSLLEQQTPLWSSTHRLFSQDGIVDANGKKESADVITINCTVSQNRRQRRVWSTLRSCSLWKK